MKSKAIRITGILFLICIFSLASFSKDYSNKQFTLFAYDIEISKDFRKEIEILDSYLETVETVQKKTKDKLMAVIIHNIYYSIKEQLEEQIEIEILPANSFLSGIKYNDYGYPDATISQAARQGDTKYYFKVTVTIETVTEEQREVNPELFENMDEMVTMPQVNVKLDIFTKDGVISVDNWEGFATATHPIRIDKNLFKNYDPKSRGEIDTGDELVHLHSIVNRAIENMVESVYKK